MFKAILRMLVFAGLTFTAAMGQQQIDPSSQIQWPLITGSGLPGVVGLVCSSTNYGQPYQNLAVTPNTFYTCGTDGWVIRGGGGVYTNSFALVGEGESTLAGGTLITTGDTLQTGAALNPGCTLTPLPVTCPAAYNAGPLGNQDLMSRIRQQPQFVNALSMNNLAVGGSTCATMTANHTLNNVVNYAPGGSFGTPISATVYDFIWLGKNDALNSTTAASYATCVNNFLQTITLQGFTPVLLGTYLSALSPDQSNGLIKAYNDYNRTLAGQTINGKLIRFFDIAEQFSPTTLDDNFEQAVNAANTTYLVSAYQITQSGAAPNLTSSIVMDITGSYKLAANYGFLPSFTSLMLGGFQTSTFLNYGRATWTSTAYTTCSAPFNSGDTCVTAALQYPWPSTGLVNETTYGYVWSTQNNLGAGLHMGPVGYNRVAQYINAVWNLDGLGTAQIHGANNDYHDPQSGVETWSAAGCFTGDLYDSPASSYHCGLNPQRGSLFVGGFANSPQNGTTSTTNFSAGRSKISLGGDSNFISTGGTLTSWQTPIYTGAAGGIGRAPVYDFATPVVNITNCAFSSNTATFLATNTLAAGQIVYLQNSTACTFLNNQFLTVSATGLSGSGFQASFTNASTIAATPDTPTASRGFYVVGDTGSMSANGGGPAGGQGTFTVVGTSVTNGGTCNYGTGNVGYPCQIVVTAGGILYSSGVTNTVVSGRESLRLNAQLSGSSPLSIISAGFGINGGSIFACGANMACPAVDTTGNIISYTTGSLGSVLTVNNSGNGSYAVGDTQNVVQPGASGGTFSITTIKLGVPTTSFTVTTAGSGYVAGYNAPLVYVSGTGTCAGTTVYITGTGALSASNVFMQSFGANCVAGDVYQVLQGNNVSAQITISAAPFSVTTGGSGYQTSTGHPTTLTYVSGTGSCVGAAMTLNVAGSLTNAALSFGTLPTGCAVGDVYQVTQAGATPGTITIGAIYGNGTTTGMPTTITRTAPGYNYVQTILFSPTSSLATSGSGAGLTVNVTAVFAQAGRLCAGSLSNCIYNSGAITTWSSQWGWVFTKAAEVSPTTNVVSFTAPADTGTSAVNAFNFTDSASTVRTGALMNVNTTGASSEIPLQVTAKGTANGVQMSTAGALSAIGTGAINATNSTPRHHDYWNLQGALFSTSTALGSVYFEDAGGTIKAVVARLSGTISCTVAPTVAILDLGTVPTTVYGSATVLTSLATGTADGAFKASGLAVAVTAGHYVGMGFSAGTCVTAPTFDLTVDLQ